jgi:hypothetical protein
MRTDEKIIVGLVIIFILISASGLMIQKVSINEGFEQGKQRGIADTHKEAFEHGLMIKEITKDDKVIYKWIDMKDKN